MIKRNYQQIKTKAFAKEFVDNGMNGKQAILTIQPQLTDNSATNSASRLLSRDDVKLAVAEELEARKLNLGHIIKKHKRNVDQNDNFAASNTAIDMFYRLIGAYAPEKKQTTSLNVNIDDHDVHKVLAQLGGQIKQLKDTFQ